MNKGVVVRFECGQEDRWSQDFGPFDFVQLTYGELRVGPDGDPFAFFNPEAGEWRIINDATDAWFSDVIFYRADE